MVQYPYQRRNFLQEKKKNLTIVSLSIIIVILITLIILVVTNTINFEDNKFDNDNQNIVQNNNDNSLTSENKISNEDISEEKLKEIIEKQLFILFTPSNPITKIEDIDNKSKLLLALNILQDDYTISSNDINTTIVNVTKSKLEEAFNRSVISNLGIKHENFDIYELTNDSIYNRNTDLLVYSKEMYKYMLPHANKVKSYEKEGNQYIVSMNYLFPDDNFESQYYYGSLSDVKNETNSIIKAYDENGTYINAQNWEYRKSCVMVFPSKK